MKKRIALTLAVCMGITAALAGCGEGDKGGTTASISPDAAYPIQTEETLKIWKPFSARGTSFSSEEELPYVQEYMKKTGIKAEFIDASGNALEKLRIMFASNEEIDIIYYNFLNYPGGPEKALEEGNIIALNDYMTTYAKNFGEVVNSNEEVKKYAKTSKGDYYTFPQINGHEEMLYAYGPIIRQDWLDELGLEMPETLDDWYTALKAFKEKKGAKAPLIFEYGDVDYCGIFFSAYGVTPGFYHDDGVVKFGPTEPGYKKGLEFLNKLYTEGLLSESITSVPTQERDSMMLNGQSGAVLCWLVSGMEKWQGNSSVAGTSFNLQPAPYPSLEKGTVPMYAGRGSIMNPVASIGGLSKKKELAAKYIDYAYTEEGQVLASFGIEGQGYEMVDGKPKLTDLILKNPDGLTIDAALTAYTSGNASYHMSALLDSYKQKHDTPRQLKAAELWSVTDAKNHQIPSAVSIPEDNSKEYSKLYADIETYVQEMFYKFVMGQVPLTKYDDFVAQLKSMNVDRVIEIKQQAFDLYK